MKDLVPSEILKDLNVSQEEILLVEELCACMQRKASEGKRFVKFKTWFDYNPHERNRGDALSSLIPNDPEEITKIRRFDFFSWITEKFGVSKEFSFDIQFCFDYELDFDWRERRAGEHVGKRLKEWVNVSNLWS